MNLKWDRINAWNQRNPRTAATLWTMISTLGFFTFVWFVAVTKGLFVIAILILFALISIYNGFHDSFRNR